MQILFLWDTAADADESMARQLINDSTTEDELRAAALEWSKATWEQRDSIDRWVGQVAPQWPPNRQPIVDRNLLRLAVWELTNTPTPPKVVIDEAIELAKVFSTEQSARFVNGVLDKILKEHRKVTGDPHVTEKLNGADATATNPEET